MTHAGCWGLEAGARRTALGIVLAVATSACGDTNETGATRAGSTGGTVAANGGSNAGGQPSSNGGAGGTAATSPGTVTIEFSPGSQTYCANIQSCASGPTIQILDSSGQPLVLSISCSDTRCDTCQGTPCPGYFCPPGTVAENIPGAKMDWDGLYYARSTCSASTSCFAASYAAPGRYTARFCASPGSISAPSGTSVCMVSGPAVCSSIEFDFPSAGSVKKTLGT
jgi:hypothetical protein